MGQLSSRQLKEGLKVLNNVSSGEKFISAASNCVTERQLPPHRLPVKQVGFINKQSGAELEFSTAYCLSEPGVSID